MKTKFKIVTILLIVCAFTTYAYAYNSTTKLYEECSSTHAFKTACSNGKQAVFAVATAVYNCETGVFIRYSLAPVENPCGTDTDIEALP